MGPSLEDERRRHRNARNIAIASAVLIASIVAIVWMVGLLGREVVSGDPTAADRPFVDGGTNASAQVLPAGKPTPQMLAAALIEPGKPGLRIQLPIRREAITGIGLSSRNESGTVELQPTGRRANLSWGRRLVERFLSTEPAGDLQWYRLSSGTPSIISVGAVPGTDAYAPIDGTVIAITDYVVAGTTAGVVIQLQPLGDAQTVVIIRNIDAAADLAVGKTVSEGATLLGTVRDMDGLVDAPLAAYTHDSGTALEMYVRRTEDTSRRIA
jgi:hypothetical protein